MTWTPAKYPGDAARRVDLVKDGDLGTVRIQDYGAEVRVASFLPGIIVAHPGDTSKCEPEISRWCPRSEADAVFERELRQAIMVGWQPREQLPEPEPHGCTYPACKCIVSTSTLHPAPICPKGLRGPNTALPEDYAS